MQPDRCPAEPATHPGSPGERPVIERTYGHKHGQVTRLVSPSNIGRRIKPFVFLDQFSMDAGTSVRFAMHPHSGLATLTMLVDGTIKFPDSNGVPAQVKAGGMEWMRAGGGIWHGGPMESGERVRGYQLWVRLPPDLELAHSEERFLLPADVPEIGPARLLLGHYAGRESLISAPSPMTYLHVCLESAESWRFTPPPNHDLLWIAVYEGSVSAGDRVAANEFARFAPGDRDVLFRADERSGFVLGSAQTSPYDLVLGDYSVHTNTAALRQGEANIRALGNRLRGQHRLA